MKKAIIYVLTNKQGGVKTFRLDDIDQDASDTELLGRHGPETLTGDLKEKLDTLVNTFDYSLSNWHVIEPEDIPDSREKMMMAALTNLRDSDRFAPSINRIAKAALPHFKEGDGEICTLCGEPLNDMIHIATAGGR